MQIRILKAASNATDAHIVRYLNHKRIILQHISSARREEKLNDFNILFFHFISVHFI